METFGSAENRSTKKNDIKNNEANTSILDTVASSFQKPSLSSLILWNISKALEKNPNMNLKSSLEAAQHTLGRNTRGLNSTNSQCPEEQHLTCALLAWHQLGHEDAYSLFEFIQQSKQRKLYNSNTHVNIKNHTKTKSINIENDALDCSEDMDATSLLSYSKGPVVKLPVETNIVMRCENSQSCQKIKNRPLDSNTMKKIEAACCMDSACTERLTAMDTATAELRARVEKLAKREAERAEILQRAETAWGDLELGYLRRLAHSEEKEDDISRQIQKAIENRNADKNACTQLGKQLKEAGDAAEKEHAKLKEVEKELSCRACFRLKLSEEVARGESAIADLQCKLIQLDRDLQLKEEQARRKLVTIDNETESARVLTYEAERALRAELAGLQQQIKQVSAQLLEEDEVNTRIKAELEQIRQQKMGLVEDLDGCKSMCDSKMQAKLNELKEKRKQVEQLKEKVIQCQCKVPVDLAVTVKRTPSLAALCKCTPEDGLLESCSCTSLRGKLISNLFADLFGGLQSELGEEGSQMPCELLKCLEDKHNWDRSSVVKTNLWNYFSKLLVGELDIAIATSIENYHAKWVGASCADEAKMMPDSKTDLKGGWPQRALEQRAQKLAVRLAEQLFEERAEELTKRAKEIIISGPPPCDCKKEKSARVLTCLTDMKSPFGVHNQPSNQTQTGLARTRQDVKELKLQIENLKKDSIKKEDLKLMEEKIAEIVKQTVVQENENCVTKDIHNCQLELNKRVPKNLSSCKTGCTKRRINDSSYAKKNVINEKPTKQPKKYIHHQSYAVNLCLCGPMKTNKNLHSGHFNIDAYVNPSPKPKSSNETIAETSHITETKPLNVNNNVLPELSKMYNYLSEVPYCSKKYKCFHKVPSTTSLDKLLETLTKWKFDLCDRQEKIINYTKSTNISSEKFFENNDKDFLKHKVKNDSKIGFLTNIQKQDTEFEVCNEVIKDIKEDKKALLFNYQQAVHTPSINMVAINSVKSNEMGYKNPNRTYFAEKGKRHENNETISNGQTYKYKISKHLHVSDVKHIRNVKKFNEYLNRNIKHTTNLNFITNLKNTKTVKSEVIMIKSDSTEIVNQKYLISGETSQTQLILNKRNQNNVKLNERNEIFRPPNHTHIVPNKSHETNLMTEIDQISKTGIEYYIKFLGVTLAEVNSQGERSHTQKSECNKNKIPKSECELLAKNLTKPKDIELLNTESKCKSNLKLDKLNSYVINTIGNLQKSKSFVNDGRYHFVIQNDNGHHSQNLNYLENNREQCVCCNAYKDDPKDLEENVFHLLEDHLKEKLRDFKICGCEATCTLPEEEEKIFATILTRVRQVISNYANEMKCIESRGTWKRAYGLLREYLKLKIERVQGISLDKGNDDILPEILNKVCNLIENDFQRLKHICKCKNNDKVTNNILFKNFFDSQESHEKDTNTSIKQYVNRIFKIFRQDSTKLIKNIQNMSCQITPNLWMETKSCEAIVTTNNTLLTQQSERNFIKSLTSKQSLSAQVLHNLVTVSKSCNVMEMDNKNEQTTETIYILSNKESQVNLANYFDCYRSPKSEACNGEVLKLCRNKEILLNLYADVLVNCDVIRQSKQTLKQNIDLGFVTSLPNLNNKLNTGSGGTPQLPQSN